VRGLWPPLRLTLIVSYLLGIDIGTSGSKAVAVDHNGDVVATEYAGHSISRPQPGWAEQDASVWWNEVRVLSAGILRQLNTASIDAVCVSGMGPCLLPATAEGAPLRPAILYGIDTRAEVEIVELTSRLGADAILQRGGSLLSSQAVGPKLLWLRHHEPEVWARTRRFFMPSSFAVWHLTGEYVLDHHSASQCDPLYDLVENRWAEDWVDAVAPGIELPQLRWPGEIAGSVTRSAAELTGLQVGAPVLAGTIDAWAESLSVGAINPGDVMLMYGSTMFLTKVVAHGTRSRSLWATAGVRPGTETLAAGMATGGILAAWFADIVSEELGPLMTRAASVGAGAEGILILPYFAGERTPIFDPEARGTLLGLTLSHTREHLMRAVLEAVGFGVRHNLEAFSQVSDAGLRHVAVGGGAQTRIWPQVVSDIAGISQIIPRHTIGAALGDAMLAAEAVGIGDPVGWNAAAWEVQPNPEVETIYSDLYSLYRAAYEGSRDVTHRLVRRNASTLATGADH
jgi:xylulokinase